MPTTPEERVAAYSEAFNKGSDARIQGVALHDNPYDCLAKAGWWEKGWIDADKFWAKDAKRWFPKLLPPARGIDREVDRPRGYKKNGTVRD
jgi:hypothetical protein